MKPIFYTLLLLLLNYNNSWALTFMVSNTNDAGAGSLRQAISNANGNAGADVINFSIAGTLIPSTALPSITDAVIIDGTTAPGYVVGTPTFIIDIANGGTNVITANGVTGITVKGIHFNQATASKTCFYFINSTNLRLEDNIIQNTTYGINIDNSTDVYILNNSFISAGVGGRVVRLNNITSSVLPRAISMVGNNYSGSGNGFEFRSLNNQIIGDPSVAGANIVMADNDGKTDLGGWLLYLVSVNNSTVENLDLSWTGNASPSNWGIWWGASSNSQIVNNTFDNRSFAIEFNGSTNCIVNGNIVTNTSNGVRLLGGTDYQVINNSFINTGINGGHYIMEAFSVNASILPKGLLFQNNSITGGGIGGGLYFNNTNNQVIGTAAVATANIILMNDYDLINFSGSGIHLVSTNNTTIEGLKLSSKQGTRLGTGLHIETSTAVTTNQLTICNRNNGLFISGGSGHSINNCSLTDNAIGVNATNNNLTILANTINDNVTGIQNNSGGNIVNATNNYWGATDGSTTDGGSGDTYTGNVTNTATFLTVANPTTPDMSEINLQGNAITITDGDLIPGVSDNTNMGTAGICGGSITQTYTIQNTGGADLNISTLTSSNGLLVISGISLPAVVTAAGSTTFDITFIPTALGVQNSTINIENDDCDEADYNFAVTVEAVTGGPGITDDLRDNAINFDGTNDNIRTNLAMNTSAITLEAWFNTNNTTLGQSIIHNGGDGSGCTESILWLDNGEVKASRWWGSCANITSPIVAGQWYHAAAVFTTTETRLYLNGVLIGIQVGANPNPLTNATRYNIGAGRNGTIRFFDGQLDEVRIWNIARTEQNIRENMHLTLGGCEAGLVAYYQMNEGSGTTVADKSGNGNTGTLTGGPTWQVSGVNVGNDISSNSNSQTITAPAGVSTQNFASANATMRFFQHSGVEDITVTYQEFTPNIITGADGINIIQNPMWTVNKSTTTETMVVDYTFTFPTATFTSLDPAKYSLYWRAMYEDGNWAKIATANAITATTATFGKISLTGQFMVVQESDILISDVRGNMYTFDGGEYTDHTATAIGLPQGNDPRTMEAWIKTTQSGLGNIISWGRRSNNMRNSLAVRSNVLGFVGEFNDFNGVTPINDGQWHHVAITHDGTTMRLYVDGKLDASSNRSFNTTDQNLRLATITMPSSGENYTGSLDEVRIWDAALTQNQLRENMHLTLKGNEAGLVAYFQFNNDDAVGTAAGVKDAVGGNHGSTVNMEAVDYAPSEVAVAGGTSDRITIGAGGTYTFPNTGVNIEFGASTPNGEIVISRLETEKPHGWNSIGGDVDNEYFVINNYGSNSTFSPLVDLSINRMSYISPADVGQPQATSPLNLYKRNDRAYGSTWGSTWGGADAASAGTNGMVSFNSVNNLTSFSQIVIVNTALNSDLPVELLNFNAERLHADQVQLDWSTASETNNKGFFLERMLELENEFETIAFVDGQGTVTSMNYYQSFDDNSYTGVSYYRLKQVDFDGTTSYSSIKAVTGTGQKSTTLVDLSIYPNPVHDLLKVRFNELSENINAATIKIMSVNGQVLHQFATDIESYQVLNIDYIQQLTPALYLLSIELNNGRKINQKFIKQ